MSTRSDVVIVGAGILGLAVARELLLRDRRRSVVVLEKEAQIAQHQTGRNSGVIHSGIYYKPGSLKARLCVTGAAAMYAYCAERGIPHQRCGKLIVATEPAELPRLQELYERGVANGVQGLRLLGPEQIRELEPHAVGLRAIHSPNTGIVDYGLVAEHYAADIRALGGAILTGHAVNQIVRTGQLVWLDTAGGLVEARHVITCGGVYADRLAAQGGGPPDPRIVPFRGDYYVLTDRARHLINGLIYPVPDPQFPFLGVHSTLRMDGTMWLGPNAVLAFGREGYGRFDLHPADLWDAVSYRGFRTLARRFWRTGLDEMVRDYSKRRFVAAAQRFVPALSADDVLPGPAGIRAQALAADGALVDDFVFNQDGPVIHVRNAPSPGATSSLTIAAQVADMAAQAFGWSTAVPSGAR